MERERYRCVCDAAVRARERRVEDDRFFEPPQCVGLRRCALLLQHVLTVTIGAKRLFVGRHRNVRIRFRERQRPGKPVPDLWHRDDVAKAVALVTQELAKQQNVLRDIGVGNRIPAPNGAYDLFFGDHLSRPRRQKLEEIDDLGAGGQRDALAEDEPPLGIEGKLIKRNTRHNVQ